MDGRLCGSNVWKFDCRLLRTGVFGRNIDFTKIALHKCKAFHVNQNELDLKKYIINKKLTKSINFIVQCI